MIKLLNKILFVIKAKMNGSTVHLRATVKNQGNISIGKKSKILAMAAIDGQRFNTKLTIGDRVTINPYVQVNGNVTIEDGTEINNFTFIAGGHKGIKIGKDVLIGPHVTMVAANHRFDDPTRPVKHQGDLAEEITIGDDVWIGAGAIVLPGVHIGRGTVVGAGAVVTKSCAEGCVLMGVPARVHSYRPGFGGQ